MRLGRAIDGFSLTLCLSSSIVVAFTSPDNSGQEKL